MDESALKNISCSDANVGLISGIERKDVNDQGETKKRKAAKTAHWLGHVVLLTALAWLTVGRNIWQRPSMVLRPTEEMYGNLPQFLQYEQRSMDPRVGPNRAQDSSWIGPLNEMNTRLWQNITTLGVISITEKEYMAMGMPTSRANSTGEHFIVPQMFHDLHCLKKIRESYWVRAGDVEDHEKHHLDHCVEIFRRNIMCAADLSPYPFHWGGDKHRAEYDIMRQCRAWDPIYIWSLQRNTTGYVL